jgi:hypothetical protein
MHLSRKEQAAQLYQPMIRIAQILMSELGHERRVLQKTAVCRLPLYPVSGRVAVAMQYVAKGHFQTMSVITSQARLSEHATCGLTLDRQAVHYRIIRSERCDLGRSLNSVEAQ